MRQDNYVQSKIWNRFCKENIVMTYWRFKNWTGDKWLRAEKLQQDKDHNK